MKKMIVLLVMLSCLVVFLCAENVEKVIVEGNKKISRETILFYLKTRENGVYIEEKLREDLKTLFETGFFENIRIEADNGKTGKIVKIVISENPLISSVTFKTGKKLKEGDITSKLQESNISLLPLSYYNPAKVKKAQKIIQALLMEKGFHEGKVSIEDKMANNQVALSIIVDVGPKARIGDVVFPGLDAKKVSPSFLRRGMKNNQTHDILSSIAGKDLYNREKIDEDLEEIRLRLQQNGYLEARVGTPEVNSVRHMTVWGTSQKMLKMSIPVEMGPQYRLRNLVVEGNKMIRGEYLKSVFKIKKGYIYNVKKRNKAIEAIQKLYGSLGFFYAQVIPSENLDPIKQTVDLTVRIQEGDLVYLGKLEFKGNTFTKDHVLRREWFLREGKIMNMNALESSIRRMKQLGLVTIDKMPELKPDPQDPQKINITAEVKELNRQQINFNVGYSGYQGWFFSLGYSTQNFLGMGEMLNISFLNGSRSKEYQFGFTEPYLFNLPVNFGIDVFKTESHLPGFPTQKSTGFSISSSWRFWRYWGGAFSYGYQNIEVLNDLNQETDVLTYPSELYSGYPYGMYYQPGKHVISYISPTLQYTTVDSPIFPSSGVKYLVNYRFSGGFLGGDIWLHKYKFEFVKFEPILKRHVLGFHAVYQVMKTFGGKGMDSVPYYERFFLGGEQSIRGYEIWQIGPRTPSGSIIGGDKAFFLNFEYAIPISQQFSFIAFYDVGNAYDTGIKVNLKNVYSSSGLELRVYIPLLGVPIRLILAYNNRLIYQNNNHFTFRFAIGPSFY